MITGITAAGVGRSDFRHSNLRRGGFRSERADTRITGDYLASTFDSDSAISKVVVECSTRVN